MAWEKTYSITGIHQDELTKSWQADAERDPVLAARVKWLFQRPAEELYDLASDPLEMKNLADEPQFAEVKASLRKQLDAWMQQQGDIGLATELLANTRQGKSEIDKEISKNRKRQPRSYALAIALDWKYP